MEHRTYILWNLGQKSIYLTENLLPPWSWIFIFKSSDFDALNFVVMYFFLRQNEWKEPKMTVVIILRKAFLKNNSIEVIKCLKLLGFKCKNDFKKILTAGLTFRNEFDLSLYLLQLLKIWSGYICFSSTSWLFLTHSLSVTDFDQFSAKNQSLRLFLKVSDGKGLFRYGNAEEEHQTQYYKRRWLSSDFLTKFI